MNTKGVREIVEEAVQRGSVVILSDVGVRAITPLFEKDEIQEEDLVSKPKKYRNVPTYVGELRFDSKREAERWLQLLQLQKVGAISDLKRQVPFVLSVGETKIGKLILDFTYSENGSTVHEDVKSPATITQVFRWKKKHFEAQYGHTIQLFM